MESTFQRQVKRNLQELFDGCLVQKMDPNYTQGIPDYLVIFKDKYAFLEIKDHAKANHRPNQDYYIQKFNSWAFASFIYPENKEEVLDRLEKYFRS